MALEFGVQLKAFPSDGSTDLLRFYDDQIAGLPPEFTSLWVSDHFQFGHEPALEGWTWLTYLAVRYPRFKAGHLVRGQRYRHPALRRNRASPLPLLSAGRYRLGLGAGWREEEYRSNGHGYSTR